MPFAFILCVRPRHRPQVPRLSRYSSSAVQKHISSWKRLFRTFLLSTATLDQGFITIMLSRPSGNPVGKRQRTKDSAGSTWWTFALFGLEFVCLCLFDLLVALEECPLASSVHESKILTFHFFILPLPLVVTREMWEEQREETNGHQIEENMYRRLTEDAFNGIEKSGGYNLLLQVKSSRESPDDLEARLILLWWTPFF